MSYLLYSFVLCRSRNLYVYIETKTLKNCQEKIFRWEYQNELQTIKHKQVI